MSYLEVSDIQDWLETTKFAVPSVNRSYEDLAATTVLGKLNQRYDTSLWTDGDSTPSLVLRLISMLVAAYELRKAASEEDGLVGHAVWLERRVMEICASLISGELSLGDVAEDVSSSLGGGSATSLPNNESTKLAESDPCAEGATPIAFSMSTIF